jgi:hypothetical protein
VVVECVLLDEEVDAVLLVVLDCVVPVVELLLVDELVESVLVLVVVLDELVVEKVVELVLLELVVVDVVVIPSSQRRTISFAVCSAEGAGSPSDHRMIG